jgi:hypothetical protein
MKTIWDIYQFVNFRLNKEQSGRVFTPENFNLACSFADFELMKLKYGLPEQYRPGSPVPAQGWEITQEITDALSHLKVYMGGKNEAQLLIDKNGYANIPDNYLHYSAIAHVDYDSNCSDEEQEEIRTPVEVVKDGDWDPRISDTLTKPDMEYPICRFNSGYIEFRPRKLGAVDFTYLRQPIPAVLGYTIDANYNIVYDELTSTQPDWPVQMYNELAVILYNWMAVNVQSQVNIQDAQQRKIQGW